MLNTHYDENNTNSTTVSMQVCYYSIMETYKIYMRDIHKISSINIV